MEHSPESRENPPLIKNINGRPFSNLNAHYPLPSVVDRNETMRLNRQGLGFKIAMDGLYFCPDVVERLLYPKDGEVQKVLDVGCGTGMWAVDMAQRFPHVSVLGIDLSPRTPNPASDPPNVQFQVYDINNGMEQFYGQFDVIQMRCVAGGIKDIHDTLTPLLLSLKPGGFITIIDGDRLLNEDRSRYLEMKAIDGDENVTPSATDAGSWFQRLSFEMFEASKINGINFTRFYELLDSKIWDEELCDPETMRSGSINLPVGAWASDSNPTKTLKLQAAGKLMQSSLLDVHIAWQSYLLRHGMDKDIMQEFSLNVNHELQSVTYKSWFRFGFFYARRRAEKGLPAPKLPDISEFPPLPSALIGHPMLGDLPPGLDGLESPYPALDIYDTKKSRLRH